MIVKIIVLVMMIKLVVMSWMMILRTMVISMLPTATIGTSMRTGAPSVGGRGCSPRPRM